MNNGVSGMGMKKMRRAGGDVGVNRRGLQIRAIEDNKNRQQVQDIKNRKANQQFNSVRELLRDLFKK